MSAGTDLAQQRMLSRDRGPDAGPGPSFEELKKAGYGYLIDLARSTRAGAVSTLLEPCALLPETLQPAAQALVYLVDADLAVIFEALFLDLGIIVGAGEGIAGMVVGLLAIISKIVEVALHYALGTIYAVQQQTANAGLTSAPDEALIEPLGQDLDDAATLWHDICYFDLFGYLDGWRAKFVAAGAEQKAIMVGEFSGQLLTFLATWEASSTKVGTLRLRLPPPAAEPVLAAEVIGGGAMPVAAEATEVGLRAGGPLGGLGATVTTMAALQGGTNDPRVGALDAGLTEAERRAKGLTSSGEQAKAEQDIADIRADLDTFRSLVDDAQTQEELENFGTWLDSLTERLDDVAQSLPEQSLIDADRAVREGIEIVDREIAAGTRSIDPDDLAWLNENPRHKLLSYDKDIKNYRVPEGKSILAAEEDSLIQGPVERSFADKCDFRFEGKDWSAKADFRNLTLAKIVEKLGTEVTAGRNLYADLTALPPADIQPAVRAAVEAIKGPNVEIRWRTSELPLGGPP